MSVSFLFTCVCIWPLSNSNSNESHTTHVLTGWCLIPRDLFFSCVRVRAAAFALKYIENAGQPVGLSNHLCGAACQVNAGQPVSYEGQPVIAQTNLKKLRVAKPTRNLKNSHWESLPCSKKYMIVWAIWSFLLLYPTGSWENAPVSLHI